MNGNRFLIDYLTQADTQLHACGVHCAAYRINTETKLNAIKGYLYILNFALCNQIRVNNLKSI